ncbi:MAG: hypothetical protein KDB12_16455, partial [Ilumatobacter sp.]|nr:hypothetical protein [Ilumatobacter sp.]
GICTVVATHMRFGYLPGGAHLLLGVAGYNLSRFQLGLGTAAARLRSAARTVGRVAVPAMAVAALVVALTPRYGWTTVALVNNYLGPRSHRQDHWHLWYIEAFVQVVVVITVVLAIPAVRRWERRRPYGFVLAALAVALAARELTWAGIDDPYNLRFRTHAVAAFVVAGWLVHRSRTLGQRLVTSVACLAVVVGFFGMPEREAYIAGGLLLLLWVPRVPLPRWAVEPVGVVASASMWILITHFHTWPPLQQHLPIVPAYVATVATGVGAWWAVGRLGAALRRARLLTAGAAARVGATASAAQPPGPPSGRSTVPVGAR